MTEPPVVNHHADHAGFGGPIGLVTALGILVAGRRNARLAAELADVSAADGVVDIGCGPGNAARAAARRGARVSAVDPDPMMLRLARLVTRDHPRISWSQGTAEALPVPDGGATVVWSLKTVHHWKDVTAGLAELRRALAPAGRLLVLERRVQPGATGFASHGWTEQQVESFAAQCRAAGFAGVRRDEHRRGRGSVWVVRAVRGDHAT
ncbi:SAM-dependent methyltransferase [Mycobacterium sp. 852002-50816_SCH5313054-b]|uniref:class I SAM-dependent methyltransferase n=1 Tax=Mycobacterium sp. 852002-50816_SCH5313054-b TaxID=1834092 RepID=UPI00080198B3|nr:class I SAM-dependent methyltransferase [Mycobacterium sp. 852002-50816_SCH5313054-b]OBF58800.1 SAM-dependent methyltransferase [Mycobacterium sp. 852002-50816_SCH5313054-b]